VAVRIRMKKMGRKHRPFFRICAMDIRRPRDGRVLEELGTYDPMVPETDARAILKSDRIKYWLSVGATPSDRVSVLIKKYGAEGTHVEAQRLALARLAQGHRLPFTAAHETKPPAPPAEAPAETAAPGEVASEATAETPAE
jgi:small subunit ribosomal protein S16